MGSSSSSTDLSPEEERVFIRDIAIAAEANSKEGDTFYLITQRYTRLNFARLWTFVAFLVYQ